MQKIEPNVLLDSLLYIELPSSFLHSYAEANSFLDKNIRLPIQLSDGTASAKDFDIASLNVEMILSGLLIIFAYDREHKHIEYYRRLFLALRPNIKEEMLTAVSIKINNGDYEMAEGLLHSLIGLDERCLNSRLMLAYLYEKKAKKDDKCKDEAKKIYNALICEEPPFPPVFFNAAIFFMESKDYVRAKDLLETYIALKIDDTDENEIKKVEKAQNALNYINSQAILDSNFKKAIGLLESGNIEVALQVIKTLIEEHPKTWNSWFLLGWALRCAKRWHDADQALKKSLELYEGADSVDQMLERGYSQICNERAICLMEMGNIDEAEALLQIALSKDCENIKLISNLGTLYLKKRDRERAISYFRVALYIDPKDELSMTMLKSI